jgi:poly(A) polymerase Pap1
MASSGVKQLGVTAPLSTAQPTESEKRYANDLVDELTRQRNFESTEDTNKRYVPNSRAPLSSFIDLIPTHAYSSMN